MRQADVLRRWSLLLFLERRLSTKTRQRNKRKSLQSTPQHWVAQVATREGRKPPRAVFVGKFSLLGNVACEDKVFTFSALSLILSGKLITHSKSVRGEERLLSQVTFDETKVGGMCRAAPRRSMRVHPGDVAQTGVKPDCSLRGHTPGEPPIDGLVHDS